MTLVHVQRILPTPRHLPVYAYANEEQAYLVHMRQGQNYLLAAVSLLSLRVPYRFLAFPAFSRGIVFLRVPYGVVHVQSIYETPNTALNRSTFDGSSYGELQTG